MRSDVSSNKGRERPLGGGSFGARWMAFSADVLGYTRLQCAGKFCGVVPIQSDLGKGGVNRGRGE